MTDHSHRPYDPEDFKRRVEELTRVAEEALVEAKAENRKRKIQRVLDHFEKEDQNDNKV